MAEPIDLDGILLTVETVKVYREFAQRVAQFLADKGVAPKSIPDEQARVEENGSLTVFVAIPNGEISMSVPPEHWARRALK